MTDIIINGAQGKMGLLIKQIIEEQYQDKARIVQLRDKDTAQPAPKADVIIDFSLPSGALAAYQTAKEIKAALLCGTTNLDEAFLSNLKAEKEIPVFYSANVSIGVFLFGKLLQEACALFKDYEPKMHEAHHAQKKDAPSGTAIALADSVNEALDHQYTYVYDRSQVRQKRDKKEIGISAVRGGTIVGDHEVIYAGTDEVIEFKHTAYSRAVFARGAVEAAKFLAGKPAGRYDMADVIEAQ